MRSENGADLGQLDVHARIPRRYALPQLFGVRPSGAVHDGEVAHLAVPLQQLHQPAE